MSNVRPPHEAIAKRRYRLGKRADKKQETRRRIVEAAVELHGTIGPARSSVAQIADRAGVQRHTFYAHFPTERDLLLACSGLTLDRDPLPDVAAWRATAPGRNRLALGLTELYCWYERNAGLAACVLRDADYHPLTREIVDMRIAPVLEAAAELLGEGLEPRCRPILDVALDFACWRSLSKTLTPVEAARLMADAVTCASKR
jgi:AcrR family transcriptional regulator